MRGEGLIQELFSNKRNLLRMFFDLSAVSLGIILALMAKFDSNWRENIRVDYVAAYLMFFFVIYVAARGGIHSWRFTDSIDVLSLVIVNLAAFSLSFWYLAVMHESYPKGLMFIAVFFVMGIQLFLRFFFKLYKTFKLFSLKKKGKEGVIIYGAGSGGATLIHESKINSRFPYEIMGLVDDDPQKEGSYISGIKVMGKFKELHSIMDKQGIKTVVIAIPSIERKRTREIIKEIKSYGQDIKVKILPEMTELIDGDRLSWQIRDVKIQDLLGRKEVKINDENVDEMLSGKVVFVTGGGGSIGSELARQAARHNPKTIVTIDVNENTSYFLQLELKDSYPDVDFQSEICNICEKEKLDILFEKYRPEIVFHAAAHKHVPLMEHNPEEAVKNNIFGTRKVVEAASKYEVERFVLISTDKAVNPTNVMGATKRACELITRDISQKSKTKFMVVRFGNVLGSNGSVIPIFQRLIEQGKNITLTHPDIERYFMTIPEAAQLVLEAGAIGEGGELFVLDMGEPVKILDLAKTMIELSNSDVGIDIIGLRPGEKMSEELFYDKRNLKRTDNEKIFITKIQEQEINLDLHLKKLENVVKVPNKKEIKRALKEFITSYKEAGDERDRTINT